MHKVSRERIGSEIIKICRTVHFVPGFMFFHTLRLTELIFRLSSPRLSPPSSSTEFRWTEAAHQRGLARLELLESLLAEPDKLEVLPRECCLFVCFCLFWVLGFGFWFWILVFGFCLPKLAHKVISRH